MSFWSLDRGIIRFHHDEREKLLKLVLRQRLGKEVANIPFAFDVLHEELQSFNAITEPEESNIHTFRSFGVDGVRG